MVREGAVVIDVGVNPPEAIEALIAERKQARADKNFARSDEIRDELEAKGVILLDSREGTSWKLK